MFHLEAQWPSAPTAHFFQFRPLLIGHANVVSEVFLCHSYRLPEHRNELMAKKG